MNIISSEQLKISDIVSALKEGKTIVYPTETCYGLGVDAFNAVAVEKVFQIKKRQKKKSVLVLMSDIAMAQKYVNWTPELQQIAEKYWPGALTVVTYAKNPEKFPEGVLREDGTIAFRITDHPLAEALVKKLGRPLVSTSANISAMESPYDIKSVKQMFEHENAKPDIVIDGGDLPHRTPSTIVSLVNGKMEVVRQGEIVVEL